MSKFLRILLAAAAIGGAAAHAPAFAGEGEWTYGDPRATVASPGAPFTAPRTAANDVFIPTMNGGPGPLATAGSRGARVAIPEASARDVFVPNMDLGAGPRARAAFPRG